MASKLGINVDPKNENGRPSTDELARFGWIRLVLRQDQEVFDYIANARNAGFGVVGVMTVNSFPSGDGNPSTDEMIQAATDYANQIEVDCWQIGNEPDAGWAPEQTDEERSAAKRQESHDSSWCMEPADFAHLVTTCSNAIKNVRPNAVVVPGGQAGGRREFLEQCGSLPVDGIAIHPYGQHPDPNTPGPNSPAWVGFPGNFGFVGGKLDSYRIFGLPLWITEVGVNTREATHDMQASYCEAVLPLLLGPEDVNAVIWFCWSDGMVPEFGIHDGSGQRKLVFDKLA